MTCHLRLRRASAPRLISNISPILFLASAVDPHAVKLYLLNDGRVIGRNLKYAKTCDLTMNFEKESRLKNLERALRYYKLGDDGLVRNLQDFVLPENDKWKVATTPSEERSLRIVARWEKEKRKKRYQSLTRIKEDMLSVTCKLLFFTRLERFWESLKTVRGRCKLLTDCAGEAGRKLRDIDDLSTHWQENGDLGYYGEVCRNAYEALSDRQATLSGLSEEQMESLLRDLSIDRKNLKKMEYMTEFSRFCRKKQINVPAAIVFLAMERDRLLWRALYQQYSNLFGFRWIPTESQPAPWKDHSLSSFTIYLRILALLEEDSKQGVKREFQDLLRHLAAEAKVFAGEEVSVGLPNTTGTTISSTIESAPCTSMSKQSDRERSRSPISRNLAARPLTIADQRTMVERWPRGTLCDDNISGSRRRRNYSGYRRSYNDSESEWRMHHGRGIGSSDRISRVEDVTRRNSDDSTEMSDYTLIWQRNGC